LIYSGPVQGVRDQMSSGLVVWVKVAANPERAVEILKGRPEVAEVTPVDGRIKVMMVNHDTDHGFVADILVQGGLRLTGLQEDELGLEEVFLRVTRGETQ
jgi:hypothetical protein